jgi:hypothetical protein
MLVGLGAFQSQLYLKLFVPWRHKMVPYSEGQMAWRNAFGSKLSNPAVRRSFLAVAGLSWIAEKVRENW